MGVEKQHITDASLCKSNSVDVYRPPGLRNKNVDDTAATATEAKPSSIVFEDEPISIDANDQQSCAESHYKSSAIAVVTSVNESEKPPQHRQHQTAVTRRERRPDRAVYIPRARRSQTTPPTAITTTTTAPVVSTHNQQQQQQHLTISTMDRSADSVATATQSNVDNSTSVTAINNTAPTAITKTKKSKINSANKERKERVKKSSGSTNVNTSAVEFKENDQPTIVATELEISATEIVANNSKSFRDRADQIDDEANDCDRDCQQPQQTTEEITQTAIAADTGRLTPTTEHINVDTMGRRGNQHKHSNNKSEKPPSNALRIEDVAASNIQKCDNDEQELQRASKEINRSNRRIMKQTFVSDVLEIPEKIVGDATNGGAMSVINTSTNAPVHQLPDSTTEEEEEEDDEDDWENMFDESGECLDPKIMQELTASVGKVKIELPKMDYTAYLTKQAILNEEEFPHVLEVSNFPMEFKNQDLLMVFAQYKASGFDIKWVDDTHALAVFSSSTIAAEVLTMGHPFVVLKPLAEATVESRLKAKKCAASLQPYKPRPETCAALARRLVTGALGVRLKTAAAERENEKRVLREAKERKLLAAKQRDEVWES